MRARWIGHKVRADIEIGVDPNISVREADVIAAAVEAELGGHVFSFGGATVRIRSDEAVPGA